jgi:hypothetical protein
VAADAQPIAKAKRRKKKKKKERCKNTGEGQQPHVAAKKEKAGPREEDIKARMLGLSAENVELRTEAAHLKILAAEASRTITEGSGEEVPGHAAVEACEEDSVDMSAWNGYGLDPLVVKALAAKRFTSPTAIQHECLPATVLGGADIIGAAQTVRLWQPPNRELKLGRSWYGLKTECVHDEHVLFVIISKCNHQGIQSTI